MNAKVRKAIGLSLAWLAFVWIVLPALSHRFSGTRALLRFEPKVSSDYNCIFVEGHSERSFAVPWLMHGVPSELIRVRYTPHDCDQPYGILFVDPRTLAFEAHAGFAEKPSRLEGPALTPTVVRDWINSQPRSQKAVSHEADGKQIYEAIVALAGADLGHFALPSGAKVSQFNVGFSSVPKLEAPPDWPITLVVLVPIWLGVFQRPRRGTGSTLGSQLGPA